MTVAELLALFALFGVPIRRHEAEAIQRVEARRHLPPGLLPAVCAAMTRSRRLRIPSDPDIERPRDLVCAAGQTAPGGRFIVPTTVTAARRLAEGLRVCTGPEAALYYATSGRCRLILGNWEGSNAVHYYRRILALRPH